MLEPADVQARIDDLFTSFGRVTVRRMFGGTGLFAGDTMLGLLDRDGVIYLKADAPLAVEFAREGSTQFTYRRQGRPTALGFWRLPERLYDDPDELADWGRKALACAKANSGGKRPRRG